jgi:hypothetical protein
MKESVTGCPMLQSGNNRKTKQTGVLGPSNCSNLLISIKKLKFSLVKFCIKIFIHIFYRVQTMTETRGRWPTRRARGKR